MSFSRALRAARLWHLLISEGKVFQEEIIIAHRRDHRLKEIMMVREE